MPRWSILLCTALLVLVPSSTSTGIQSASFYGDSFIRLPLEDASGETDIKFNFRTNQPDALLLLAAGAPDYCVIELSHGRLRARIDLGAGVANLWSTPGVRFDDWRWHQLHLVRVEREIHVTIDGLYTTRISSPGRFSDLNINHGIFVAGRGSYTDLFYGNLENYRGCLSDIVFNSLDVFHMAKQQVDPLNVYGVTWDCSSEFGATSQQSISFLHNTSFMALPHLPARREGRISFDIRTRSHHALLFYNSGRLQHSDFIAVELLNGNVQVTVNKGSGENKLTSDRLIDDGNWHQVELLVDLTSIRVTVDGAKKEIFTSTVDNRFLDLHGNLFVGGVSLQERGQAIAKGLQSLQGLNAPAGSLVGCMQNIKINGFLQGFREAEISRGLQPECVWSYPCLSSPCIDGAVCIEEGYYTFKCVCDRPHCLKNPGGDGGQPLLPIVDVIAVHDLVVRENGRAYITSNHIEILFDYASHDIRESSIVFRVVGPPEHGEVQVNIGQPLSEPVFTLHDMQAGKVSYLHDGSEYTVDAIEMELEFYDTPESLPDRLHQRYGFTLIVKVASWNDIPVIILPEQDTLTLVENTNIKITPRILHVLDKDDEDNAAQLEYSIQYPQEFDTGYFEITENLGVRARITSFTQEDVNEGRLRYVHRGGLLANIRLQVSDGKDSSEVKYLKIQAVPLELRLVENTGIIINPGGGALITRDNLTFGANAPNQDIDIRYDVTSPPFTGEIQRMQYADNRWTTVTQFSQRHIDKGRLRYLHSYPDHFTEDVFKFKVLALGKETAEQSFRIKIHESQVTLLRLDGLVLNGVKEERISINNLMAASSIHEHGPDRIRYVVVKVPEHGELFKIYTDPVTGLHKMPLTEEGNFTQHDIEELNVIYKIHRVLYDKVQDEFDFKVMVPGAVSEIYSFPIQYIPLKGDVKIINNGLMNVPEGDNKDITMEELYMETAETKECQYTVTNGPSHGSLYLIDPSTGAAINHNVTAFTNRDLERGRLRYQHDNSETSLDEFSYSATPIIQPHGSHIIQNFNEYSGTFEIKIILRNDNAPDRVVDRVFNVVLGRGRIITEEDLLYMDPDVNFDSDNLKYTWRTVPNSNGFIANVDNKSMPISEFTQRQLKAGQVYLQHHGAPDGEGLFYIGDGIFTSTGKLKIHASEPYIRFTNNTGLSVLKGEEVALLPHNLSIETNLPGDRDVKFHILIPPRHGRILKSGQERTRFNLQHIQNGMITYAHDNSMNLHDKFNFRVRIDETRVDGELKIKIVLESHQDPPHVIHSQIVKVDEGGHAYVTSDMLLYGHPETTDEEISYTITSAPRYGDLKLENGPSGPNLYMFTQADVNIGRLTYTHTDPMGTKDIMMFDVTNGIKSLQGLELAFEIIPNIIPLQVTNIELNEGESLPVTEGVINVDNAHFSAEEIMFMVIKEPSSGWIESYNNPGTPLLQFSQAQLAEGIVFYVHDGSDTTSDSFSVMAKLRQSDKKSNPQTVMVEIMPTNDEPPVTIVNKKLEVWTGSVTPITEEHLLVEDKDTEDDDLMFVITKPSNGDVTLIDDVSQNIINFTQTHVRDGLIAFVHTGAERGEFDFQVSDGKQQDRRRTFHILAKQLTLRLVNNKPIEVFPGIRQPISTAHLMVVTNDDNQTRPITYTVRTPARKGRVALMRGTDLIDVSTFTQNDINDGFLYYYYSQDLTSWSEKDSFDIDISTAYAPSIDGRTFRMSISYLNVNQENHDTLLTLKPLRVEEGTQVRVDKENLDSSKLRQLFVNFQFVNPNISYIIDDPPLHGVLSINDVNATQNSVFTQHDIDVGWVHYFHDHSDSLWDTFTFKVNVSFASDLRGRRPTGRQVKNYFNITVLPVNDQLFEVITGNPGIQLVQGSIQNITKENLETTDPDTSPDGIKYEIMTASNVGEVVLATNPDEPIDMFTQKDINDNLVQFVHDGSMTSDAFYFRVSDGHFKPIYIVFNIIVHPLTLELKNTNNIIITQGHVSVTLAPNNFNLETNGRRQKVMYNVTKGPMYGDLFMHNHQVHQFSQQNIDDGEVTFVQTDMSVSSDYFEFSMYDSQNMILDQRVNISVRPLVKQSQPEVTEISVYLTLDILDASELADITSSNPLYTISRTPTFGDIYRLVDSRERRATEDGTPILRKKRSNGYEYAPDDSYQYMSDGDYVAYEYYNYYYDEDEPASNFTHEDIVNGVILYRVTNPTFVRPQTEKVYFILTARNAQPAHGALLLKVHPLPDTEEETGGEPEVVDPGPVKGDEKPPTEQAHTAPPIDENKEKPETAGSMNQDHMLIIITVCAITFITIVALIITRCLKHKRNRKYAMEAQKEDSRTPLAQPNIHIEPQKSPEGEGGAFAADGRRIPAINITPDSVDGESMRRSYSSTPPPSPVPGARSRSRSRSRSPAPGYERPRSRSVSPMTHRFNEYSSHTMPHPYNRGHYESDRLAQSSQPLSRSQDILRSEFSRTVPTCKVTPLCDGASQESLGGTRTPGGTLRKDKCDQVTLDWENVDPELLQHCRTTNPVLHESKYWV